MTSCGPCGPTVSGEPAGGGGMGPPGPPGPPGPSGGCANAVIVEAADPFATLPAPIANVIELLPDTLYRICGGVNIGTNSFLLPRSSVVTGEDPLVDSLTSSATIVIGAPNGGTIKDLSVRSTASGGADAVIQFGQPVIPPDPPVTVPSAVLFNLSISSNQGRAVRINGAVGMVSIARLLTMDSQTAIGLGSPRATITEIDAISIDQVVASPGSGALPGAQLIEAEATPDCRINSASVSLSSFTTIDPTDIAIRIATSQVATFRVSSCAAFGPGTPSLITLPVGTATVGSSPQYESVGCVGFDNSLQRGSAQIENALTLVPAVNVFTPIGQAIGPTYALAPSSVRVGLQGLTAPNQVLRFERVAPYSATITADISLRVGPGFSFTPRIVSARLLLNGAPLGLSFESTTPDFASGAPTSFSFTTPAELTFGDTIQLEIANLTDADPILVVAARITIT